VQAHLHTHGNGAPVHATGLAVVQWFTALISGQRNQSRRKKTTRPCAKTIDSTSAYRHIAVDCTLQWPITCWLLPYMQIPCTALVYHRNSFPKRSHDQSHWPVGYGVYNKVSP